jgi:hypothetical protein
MSRPRIFILGFRIEKADLRGWDFKSVERVNLDGYRLLKGLGFGGGGRGEGGGGF